MKEEIYSWMKNLAFFYILLTTVLHLAPSGTYQRYIRFFMGLLLILMLTSPIFSILGRGEALVEEFSFHYGKEEEERMRREAKELQEDYLKKGYEREIGKNILESLQKKGISIEEAKVYIEGEDIRAALYFGEMPVGEEAEQIKNELLEEWGMGEGQYTLLAGADGEKAVDGGSPSGASAGSDRPPSVR